MRAATLLCLTMMGCSSASGGALEVRSSGNLPAFTLIEIDNRHWSPVTVYTVRDGMRRRLGVVTPAHTTSLRVPAYLLDPFGGLQLLAIPDGAASGITTNRLRIAPGQRVSWTLEARLEMSSVGVW